MEKHLLSKSTFIRSTQCLKSLYLHKRRPFLRDRLSAEQLAKFKRGTDVGILAQQLFPGGVDLQPKAPSQYRKSVAATAEHVNSNENFTIYEASFQSDQILIILDILEQKDGKIYAYEVKSSRAISETYLKDAALQFHVIQNSGLAIEDFFIVYINEDYQFREEENQLDLYQLFKIESVLPQVKELQNEIQTQIPGAKEAINLKHSPEISIGPQCHTPYPCDFRQHCWKHVPKNSIFDLPFLNNNQKFELHSKEILELTDIKSHIQLSKKDQIKLDCHLTNNTYFDKEKIKQHLSTLEYPLHFIRFSTVGFAVPRWANCRPFEPIPLHLTITTVGEDRSVNENSFTISQNETFPKKSIFNFLNGKIKKGSDLLVFNQQGLLNELGFKSTDLHDLIKEDAVYHPGITDTADLQDINTKLLKNKKNPHILSPLQQHQKLESYLQQTNQAVQEKIILELEQDGKMHNRIQQDFFKILLSNIE